MVKSFADGKPRGYRREVATQRVINKQLDLAILQTMEEPISVSVSRVTGGARTPLLLPTRNDSSSGVAYGPGDGWEKTDIQQLEGWLVTDFSGGGLYNIKIVDAKGTAYEWQPWFDPKLYPVRVPHTMQPTSMPTGMAAQTMQVDPMSMSMSEWPPRNIPPGTPLVTPIPSQVPMSFPPFPYSNIGRVSSIDEDRRRHEETERGLRDRLAQAEREKIEEKHRADLAAAQATNDRKLEELKLSLQPKTDDATNRRLDKLEAMFEKILDKVSAPPPPSGPSPEFLQMQEQNRQMQAKMDAQEAERRHAETIAELRRQIDALAHRPTGPDPALTMLVDAFKESGRQMQGVVDGMRHQMLTPQDVLNLAKSTSSGVDELRTSVVRAFGEMFDLQKRAFESAAQMLPQGESPAVRIVEQGIEKAGEMFEKWQESKDAGQVAAAKAAAAQAKAQEAAINAQRDQLSEMARREERMHAQTQRAQANAAHAPSRTEGQLAGATPSNGQPSNVIPLKPNEPVIRLGRTDLDWFGGALAHVERLRMSVNEFLDGISTQPHKTGPDGQPVGTSPEQAAHFVARSIEQIVKANLIVPAFSELILTDRAEDFAMVLLPDAPPQYRKAMLDELDKLDEGADDDDDDDDEGDDEEDADEKAEATPTKQPEPTKGGKGQPRRTPQPRA